MDISELIEKNCEIPPLPAVATEVMRLVDDPITSIDTLQAIIMTDQVFAANLLKMANSAFYKTGRDIETVFDAIVTLGIGALKRLALADAICARLGIGYREPMNELPIMDRECLRMLDINENSFSKITEEIKKRFDEESAR